jgi:hypothetical protein
MRNITTQLILVDNACFVFLRFLLGWLKVTDSPLWISKHYSFHICFTFLCMYVHIYLLKT